VVQECVVGLGKCLPDEEVTGRGFDVRSSFNGKEANALALPTLCYYDFSSY
jgi:hypothetical protein